MSQIPNSFDQTGISAMAPGTPVTISIGGSLVSARYVGMRKSGGAVFELDDEEKTRIQKRPEQCIDVAVRGEKPRGLLNVEILEGLELLNKLWLILGMQVATGQFHWSRLAWLEGNNRREVTDQELWLAQRALHESLWALRGTEATED